MLLLPFAQTSRLTIFALCIWRLITSAIPDDFDELDFSVPRILSAEVPCSGSFAHSSDISTTAGVVRAMEAFDAGSGNVLLVAGGEDQILRVWASPFSSPPKLFYGHQEAIWAIEWIADKNVLAVGAGLGFIRFWPISTLLGDPTTCSAFQSVDGSCLGSHGEFVVSWRDAGMTRSHQVHSLQWASSITTLFSGWSDTSIRTWWPSTSLSSPDNIWVYTGYLQSQDRIFDMYWFPSAVLLGSASPDQRHPRLWKNLVSKTSPPQVASDYVYLTEGLGSNNGKGDCPWAHCDAVKGLDGSNTQNLLFSGSMDHSVILWDVVAENRVAQFTGHTDQVESVLFLQGDAKLASGSHDATVKLWDIPTSAPYSDSSSPAQTLAGHHTAAVNALAFVADTSTGYLASGGADGKIVLYTCTLSR